MLLLLLPGASGAAVPVVYSTVPTDVQPDDPGTEVVPDDWSTGVARDDWQTDVSPDSTALYVMKNGATNTLSGTLVMSDPALFPDWTGATGAIAIRASATDVLLLDYTALDSLNTDTYRYSFTPTGVSFPDAEVVYDFRITFTDGTIAYFPSDRNVSADVIPPVGTP